MRSDIENLFNDSESETDVQVKHRFFLLNNKGSNLIVQVNNEEIFVNILVAKLKFIATV